MAEPMTVLGGYRLDEHGAIKRQLVDVTAAGDYGSDPIGNDRHRMIPSGDIVDTAERIRRLAHLKTRVSR
jgi:hypothetical protein